MSSTRSEIPPKPIRAKGDDNAIIKSRYEVRPAVDSPRIIYRFFRP